MKNKRDLMINLGFYATLVVALILLLHLSRFRFQHPDLTETQLLLETWPEILVLVLDLCLLGVCAGDL